MNIMIYIYCVFPSLIVYTSSLMSKFNAFLSISEVTRLLSVNPKSKYNISNENIYTYAIFYHSYTLVNVTQAFKAFYYVLLKALYYKTNNMNDTNTN